MGYVVTRPDQAWRDAVELAAEPLSTVKDPLKWLKATSAAGVCVAYVTGLALDQIQTDKILFGDAEVPGGEIAERIASLQAVAGGSMFEGIVWDLVKRLLAARVQDPAVLDTLAGWIAVAVRGKKVVGMTAEDFKIEAHGTVTNPGDK